MAFSRQIIIFLNDIPAGASPQSQVGMTCGKEHNSFRVIFRPRPRRETEKPFPPTGASLPRTQGQRASTAIAEILNQCFNHVRNTSIHESAPMLNIPKATDKSFADAKILQSVAEGVGVITFNN